MRPGDTLARRIGPAVSGLLAAFLAGSGPVPDCPAATPFVYETVASGNAGDSGLALVVDSLNTVHLAYYDPAVPGLRYLRRFQSVWSTETVDGGTGVGTLCALALDGRGRPAVSYLDETDHSLKVAMRGDDGWFPETVASDGWTGLYSSLAFDARDRPWVSFLDFSHGDLVVARKESGSWILETVDSEGRVGWFTSIAVAPDGTVMVSYSDEDRRTLKMARRLPERWVIETIESFGWACAGTSIAVDSLGTPHISYWDRLRGWLRYARGDPYGWFIQIVDANGGADGPTSIALDGAGVPRIAYLLADSSRAARIARKSGNSWILETVGPPGAVEHQISLDLDVFGNPVVAFYQSNPGLLRLADSGLRLESPTGGEFWPALSTQRVTWRGLGPIDVWMSPGQGSSFFHVAEDVPGNSLELIVPDWTSEDVRVRVSRKSPYAESESEGPVLVAPGLVSPWWFETAPGRGAVAYARSLALDSAGTAHLAWFDPARRDLMLSRRHGSGWITVRVDSIGSVGTFASLAIGPDDRCQVAYYDETEQRLRYAAEGSGGWAIETVDAGGTPGEFASIALDADSRPAIAYYERGGGDLRVALRSGAGWILERVDQEGDVGYRPSLVFDEAGGLHVSYYDAGNGDLRMAHREGGAWRMETVASGGDVGSHSSLAWADGRLHVSYSDHTRRNVRYGLSSPEGWETEEVVPAPYVGVYNALAVGPDGTVFVAMQYEDGMDFRVFRRRETGWRQETSYAPGSVGRWPSLVCDRDGELHAISRNETNDALLYASTALVMGDPEPGTLWPLGAKRAVTWLGTGRVTLDFSADGGASWTTIAADLTGNRREMVPPGPETTTGLFRVRRAVPGSRGTMRGVFTVKGGFDLLTLQASLPPEDETGCLVSWATVPGPPDLRHYRLDRLRAGGEEWQWLLTSAQETSFVDRNARFGDVYRLTSMDLLGANHVLGEVRFAPEPVLVVEPIPYREGTLQVRFGAPGGLLGLEEIVDVTLYDAAGRVVRSLVSRPLEAGYHAVSWDGFDGSGRPVADGVYFLSVSGPGHRTTAKIVVVRP